jgi:translation initiation factor 2B subunit (eIF-2B alpha/beta/delta family)
MQVIRYLGNSFVINYINTYILVYICHILNVLFTVCNLRIKIL